MTVRRAAGLVLGFLGVLTILGVWHGFGGASLTGQLMCFGAACCYGVAIPYRAASWPAWPSPARRLAAGQLMTATAVLAVAAPLIAGPPPPLSSLSPACSASVLALGALGTGIAFALNFRIIRLAGATTSASVTYVVPVFATLEGILLLHERLAWYQPVGRRSSSCSASPSPRASSAGRWSGRPRHASSTTVARQPAPRPREDLLVNASSGSPAQSRSRSHSARC